MDRNKTGNRKLEKISETAVSLRRSVKLAPFKQNKENKRKDRNDQIQE